MAVGAVRRGGVGGGVEHLYCAVSRVKEEVVAAVGIEGGERRQSVGKASTVSEVQQWVTIGSF